MDYFVVSSWFGKGDVEVGDTTNPEILHKHIDKQLEAGAKTITIHIDKNGA